MLKSPKARRILEVYRMLEVGAVKGKEGGEAERLGQVLSRDRASQCFRRELLTKQDGGQRRGLRLLRKVCPDRMVKRKKCSTRLVGKLCVIFSK